jgi:hypothetical protein
MKNWYIHLAIAISGLLHANGAIAQCKIDSKVGADGTLYYYIEPVNFYFTQNKRLSGGIITDEEYFYLVLEPYPFPEKSIGRKLKDSLELVMSDNNTYKLPFYFSNYRDSIFEMMFAIKKEDLEFFTKFEVSQVKLDMGDETGRRTYFFKLHKHALQEQLSCFIEEKKKKK